MSRRDFNPVVGRWTPDEDARLRRLAEEGRTSAVIAERLKRSQAAIYMRAKKLGVTLKRPMREAKEK
jgi:hypothetical protein